MAYGKKLTKNETDTFLKNNQHGILSMAGDKPYALPMGYTYRRKTILLGLVTTGRKMKYLKERKKVCFTICKPRWETPKLKIPCTSLIIEGSLAEVKNRSYYGFKSKISDKVQLYKMKVAKTGARKCNRKPCELFTNKK